MSKRKMHLVAFLKTGPTAHHHGTWRHPESDNDMLDPAWYEHIARLLEKGKFDSLFFADTLGLFDTYKGNFETIVKYGGQMGLLDPIPVLAIMARVTERIGLGATMSTTFHNPYQIARVLGTLDILSKGRIAWNVVSSISNLEARNFGQDQLASRDQRYDRADEVVEACMKLWRSWDADALVMDRDSGVFADPSKVHYADYQGKHVKTRGPLTVPRSPQGHPVIMQAGASDRGRDFAARWAEAIFTDQRSIPALHDFYNDVKSRMAKFGRTPEQCAILQASTFVLGETESIARERAAYLKSLIKPETWAARVSGSLGVDVDKIQDARSLAALQGNQGIQGAEDRIHQAMKEQNLSMAQAVKEDKNAEIVGTPAQVADHLQEIFESGACDGFIVAPTYFPGMIEQFCRMVVPELQRRGLFRTQYDGKTLRENILGAVWK